MLFFGRKNDEDEEYDDDELEERLSSRRAKFKGSKGSNPRNKKKKETKKPWGKTERLLVLAAILLTAGVSGILALSSRAWKLPGFPRLTVPRLAFPFLSEETIVLEGRKADQEKAGRAVDAFFSQTRDLSGVWGLYVVRLGSGFSYGVNELEVFQAASLIKLPVMAGMYMEAEEGNLDLEEKYTLKNADKLSGSGSLYSRPAGYEITYRNLIRLMGKESDNTAFNIARNILGDEKINEVIGRLGMNDTSLEENETTAHDIGKFFEDLWFGNIINEEHKNEFLEFLTNTSFEAWLAEGVPQNVRVAHKYGRELHVVNDAGIVYAEELSEPGSSQPFVIVILSKGVVDREADNVFPSLAGTVYNIETSE